MTSRSETVFCGTDGHFCSVGCQVHDTHRDWALSDPWIPVETYADEHECGQLRIAVPGEQRSLLPLPDETIPTSDEPISQFRSVA